MGNSKVPSLSIMLFSPKVLSLSIMGYPKVFSLSIMLFSPNSKHLLNLFFLIKPYHSSSSTTPDPPIPKPFIVDYLTNTCGLSETQAIAAAKRISHIANPYRPNTVLNFLAQSGFSQPQIRDAVRVCPQILTADPDKNLKPKLHFFEQLGLTGSKLADFISKNSTVLTFSLTKRLIPSVNALKVNLSKTQDLITCLNRCKWLLYRDANTRLLPNISYLQSCGIVESQLTMLLKTQPSLVVSSQTVLRDLVNRTVEMGVAMDSRMFVYALYTLSSMSPKTLQQKFDLLRGFGFSKDQTLLIFRKAPGLFRTSEKKLKLGMDFFVKTLRFEPELLVRNPTYFMLSIETRVMPRYRVLQVVESKVLMKKKPSFLYVCQMPEAEFVAKFVSRFEEHAQELLMVYKGAG